MRRARPGPAAWGSVVALVAVIGACGGGDGGPAAASCQATEVPRHDRTSLVIEGDPWAGYAPFRDGHLLDGTPYGSVYVEQRCQAERAVDLTSGEADVAVTTLDQYLLHRPAATVVGVIDQSRGADALVLDTLRHPWLDSVDDLHRLTDGDEVPGDRPVLAYPGGSPSEVLLTGLAGVADELRLADYELVAVDGSATALQMLRTGEAQLAVISEPDTTIARSAGYAVALSTQDVPGARIDVILASDRLIERDPAAVRAVVDAYYTRMDDYLAHRDTLIQAIADDLDVELRTAGAVIDGIKLYGTNDADVFMNRPVFPLDRPQAAQSLEDIGSLLSMEHPEVRLNRASLDGSYVADVARTRYGAGTEGATGG